jgi:peptidoglycan hydrolase-like protein with peptidoglycan-binding domain
MKTAILLIFLLFITGAGAFADDQLRAVQQVLKDQGFYYGQVDGEPGNETAGAIKRFQIRNGLQANGQINPETLAAMNLGGGPGTPSPTAPEVQPKMPRPDGTPGNDLKNQPQSVPQETVAPPAAANPYPAIFRRTPYENAPGVVQQDTLKRAQMKLYRAGYYRGTIDGIPGNSTAQALLHYQADEGLPGTGRLDMDTLASLDLLPRNRPSRTYYPGGPVPGRPVYRGIWIH